MLAKITILFKIQSSPRRSEEEKRKKQSNQIPATTPLNLPFSSPMRSSSKHGKDAGDDLKVLQNEYKHMQVNRNAFANESELVSS